MTPQPPLLTRRGTLIGAALAALPACGAPVAQKKNALSDVTLRAATYRGTPSEFFALAGVDDTPYKVERSSFASGNLIVEAINARAIDVGSMSEIPPVFVAGKRDTNLRIIAVRRDNVKNQVVLAPPGSPLRSLKDLGGKRVGYVRATTSHYILLQVLEETGLAWKDIVAVPLSPQDGLAAFQSGSIDAWVIFGVVVQRVIAAGARELANGVGRLSGNYIMTAAADALEDPDRQAAVLDYLLRYRRVLDWINADDARWAKTLSANTGVSAEEWLREIKERSSSMQLLPINDEAIASQQKVADAFADAGMLPGRVDMAPLWDARFSQALS